MHEMSICQALMDQVERIVGEQGASRVDRILLSIGPLAGVEPELLSRAYEVSRAETVAENAELEIETGPIVVECRSCGASGECGCQPPGMPVLRRLAGQSHPG